MSISQNKVGSSPVARENKARELRQTSQVAGIFGKVKKPRRCQGQKFDFDFKNGIGVYRCFSRDTRIVRIVKSVPAINVNDTDIPEEMQTELCAAKILLDEKDIDQKQYNELINKITSEYKKQELNLQGLRSYSGEIKHLCTGCRATYIKRHPKKELHFLDLKLQ